jgi:hypothetical protein
MYTTKIIILNFINIQNELIMNNILDKILANKTPEEFSIEMQEIRKRIGEDTIYDISAEDVLSNELSARIENINKNENTQVFDSVGELFSNLI